MKILVLFFQIGRKNKNYINDHLYSFRRYVDGVEFFYFNAINGIPKFLCRPKFDGVIVHHSFLIRRWNREYYSDWHKRIGHLKKIKGYKIAIPQDEYAESDLLCELFREFNIKTVFSCLPPEKYHKIYPPGKIKLDHIETVLPGYIDEQAAEKIKSRWMGKKPRSIVLGFRALKYPYWLGSHGQLKYELGRKFKELLGHTGMAIDISSDPLKLIHGDHWYRFLLKCRSVLGCEGGVSLLDTSGDTRTAVEKYVRKNPLASFEETEKACFPGMDNNFNFFTISPRHFECIITRTCQVLLEGEYSGILRPGIHYIELKKDFSNITCVIEKIQDERYCEKIARRAYRDIYESSRYSYRIFAKHIINYLSKTVEPVSLIKADRRIFFWLRIYLRLREYMEPLLMKFLFPWRYLKIYKLDIFRQIRIRKFKIF